MYPGHYTNYTLRAHARANENGQIAAANLPAVMETGIICGILAAVPSVYLAVVVRLVGDVSRTNCPFDWKI